MKKILTFVVTAFLIGGLAFSANAQDKTKTKAQSKAKVENTADNAKVEKPQAPNYDQMLKDFETNINKYIEYYEKALKAGETNGKAPDYRPYMKKAQELQAKLEKAKENLTQGQMEMFLKLKDKFADALKRK